jgi:hypothetical protein
MSFRIPLIIPIVLMFGCTGGTDKTPAPKTQKPTAATKTETSADDDIKAERAKLSPDVRELVEAQEWCPVSDDRLGSMGLPIKLMIKDKPVFICCDGCKKKAETDAEKTLAKVEELKAKKKTNPPK